MTFFMSEVPLSMPAPWTKIVCLDKCRISQARWFGMETPTQIALRLHTWNSMQHLKVTGDFRETVHLNFAGTNLTHIYGFQPECPTDIRGKGRNCLLSGPSTVKLSGPSTLDARYSSIPGHLLGGVSAPFWGNQCFAHLANHTVDYVAVQKSQLARMESTFGPYVAYM